MVCRGASIKVGDANRIKKLIRKADSPLGNNPQHPRGRVRGKYPAGSNMLVIMDNASHPLHYMVVATWCTFSVRLILSQCAKEHYQKFFLPLAIRFYITSLCTGSLPEL